MRVRQVARAIALGTVLLSVPQVGVATAASVPSDPCSVARALLEARLVDRAIASYVGNAASCPSSATALVELRQRVADREVALVRAKAAAAAKQPEAARGYFVAALGADAGCEAALQGLAALDAPDAAGPFAGSQALLAAGLTDEAKDQLVKELAAGNPLTDSEADQKLRSLVPESHWWSTSSVRGFLTGLMWVAFTAIAIGGVLLAVLNHGWFEFRRRSRSRRTQQAARVLSAHWRTFTQPRLHVLAGDGDRAKMLAIQVREMLRAIDRQDGSSHIRLATYPESALDLAPLGDVDPRLKSVAALLKVAGRRDTVRTTTSIARDDGARVRVSAEIGAPWARGRSATFLAAGGENVELPPELVGRLTGWVVLTVEDVRPRIRVGEGPRDVFGTEDAGCLSAYFGGVASFGAGAADRARELFASALNHDGDNKRAQLNLAVTEVVSAEPLVRDLGLARLRDLESTQEQITMALQDLLASAGGT